MLKDMLPISVLAALALGLSGNPASAGSEQRLGNLPEGWKIEKSVVVPPAQNVAIGRRLGAKILKLTNTYVSAQGNRLQINIIHCPTAADAEKVYKVVLQAHSGISDYALRDGNSVFEFVSNDMSLVKQARLALGFGSIGLHSAAVKLIKALPPGWQVVKSFLAPQDQTAAIGKRLGGRIKNLTNTTLSAHGQQIQVNILECSTSAEAAKVYGAIRRMKDHPAFCLRVADSVVEFVGDDISLATKTAYELGLKPKPKSLRYRISFEAAPIRKCDYMSWNELYNLFLQAEGDPDSQAIRSRISQLGKRFDFGSELALRTCGSPKKEEPTYSFNPPAINAQPSAGGDITRYSFKNLPRKFGIPSVSITATVRTTDQATVPTARKANEDLLKSTQFWPGDSPEIIALAKKITAGCTNQQDKVNNILQWLQPGSNIQFGGSVTGSRYGVQTTLRQGFGQCWDFSDCFITLCRASGVPARQVAGWFYGQSGHIWAEVLFENRGWQQVDPTGGTAVKCGIYHIAYLTSEDGSLPIVYLSSPKIDILDQ